MNPNNDEYFSYIRNPHRKQSNKIYNYITYGFIISGSVIIKKILTNNI